MSSTDIPAGWQPDPRGRHEYRYWDGTQWTDHVSDQGEVSSDPVADTTPAASDAEKSQIFSPESTGAEPTPAVEPAASEPTEVQPVASEPEPVASEPEPVASEPEPVASEPAVSEPEPEPVAVAAPTPAASTAPPGATPRPTPTATEPATPRSDAKAAAQDVLKSRSPELATVLTAAVPGSGHFYLGTDKVPLAAGLLGATLAAVIISHMGFIFFLIGFAIWAGAVVFGLTDLRGSVAAVKEVSLPGSAVGIVMIAAGALLIISLLLPYYRVSIDDAGGFGGSGSFNAFDALDIIPILLLIVGVSAIVGGAASLGLGPISAGDLPRQLPTAIAVGGAIAVLAILFRMLLDPFDTGGADGVSIGRAFGMWIGLWSAILLTLANVGLLKSLANKS